MRMHLQAPLAGIALLATAVPAQTNGWVIQHESSRVFVTISIESTNSYEVTTSTDSEGTSNNYPAVSGKSRLETFGIGPGDLHVTVNRLEGSGNGTLYTVDCPESSPPPFTTDWHSRHYSFKRPHLKCSDQADIVIIVASL
jgi:hypothetical protein